MQAAVHPPVHETVQPAVLAMVTVSPPKKELATREISGAADMSPFVAKAVAAAGELNCDDSAFLLTEVLANDAPRVSPISMRKIKYFFIAIHSWEGVLWWSSVICSPAARPISRVNPIFPCMA